MCIVETYVLNIDVNNIYMTFPYKETAYFKRISLLVGYRKLASLIKPSGSNYTKECVADTSLKEDYQSDSQTAASLQKPKQ